MTEEFYPMPLFVRMFIRDVAATAKWYADALGFRSVYAQQDPNGNQIMNHIRLAKYQDLMLLPQLQDAAAAPSNELIISFSYDGDLEALAQCAVSAGATVGGPTAMPYNAFELTVIDPSGFILIFSQNDLSQERKFKITDDLPQYDTWSGSHAKVRETSGDI